jgi:MipA family protein
MNMHSIPMASLLYLSVIAMLQPAPLHAAEPAEEVPERSYEFGLGVAAAAWRNPYTDSDDDFMALPMIRFENRWISFAGGDLDLKLPSAGPVEFTIAARYQNDGYDANDAPILAGMESRDESLWAGATIKWENRFADLSAEWLMDTLGNSEGQQVRLAAEHRFQLGNFHVSPRVEAHWMDDDYVDYYFGVRPGEALGNRPFYEGSATTNLGLGVQTTYMFSEKQSVFLDVQGELLGAEIEDSPLVDSSSRMRVAVGYMYLF